MKSQNQQHLIAQELSKIECNINEADYKIVGYEIDGDYRIAVSPIYGMFSQSYMSIVLKLSKEYGFHFYVSDTCAAIHDINLFIIIY